MPDVFAEVSIEDLTLVSDVLDLLVQDDRNDSLEYQALRRVGGIIDHYLTRKLRLKLNEALRQPPALVEG